MANRIFKLFTILFTVLMASGCLRGLGLPFPLPTDYGLTCDQGAPFGGTLCRGYSIDKGSMNYEFTPDEKLSLGVEWDAEYYDDTTHRWVGVEETTYTVALSNGRYAVNMPNVTPGARVRMYATLNYGTNQVEMFDPNNPAGDISVSVNGVEVYNRRVRDYSRGAYLDVDYGRTYTGY